MGCVTLILPRLQQARLRCERATLAEVLPSIRETQMRKTETVRSYARHWHLYPEGRSLFMSVLHSEYMSTHEQLYRRPTPYSTTHSFNERLSTRIAL